MSAATQLEPMLPDWCDECGARHTPARRRALVARMLPASLREIVEEWPHFYPDYTKNSASCRMLIRDLHALGAKRLGDGLWGPS